MKIVIAADSFKGSCSTFEVAEAIETGIRNIYKDMEIIKIPVYMIDEDARKFLLFQEHYDLITLLLENKIYEMKNGSITLHFDGDCAVRKIESNKVLFKS